MHVCTCSVYVCGNLFYLIGRSARVDTGSYARTCSAHTASSQARQARRLDHM